MTVNFEQPGKSSPRTLSCSVYARTRANNIHFVENWALRTDVFMMDTACIVASALAVLLYINTLPADFAYDDR